jgi:hypothetical protein
LTTLASGKAAQAEPELTPEQRAEIARTFREQLEALPPVPKPGHLAGKPLPAPVSPDVLAAIRSENPLVQQARAMAGEIKSAS